MFSIRTIIIAVSIQDEIYYEKILHKKDHYYYAKEKGEKCEEYPDDIG